MARLLTVVRRSVAQVALVLALVAVWAWGAASGWLDEFSFGSPAATGDQLVAWVTDGTLLLCALSTLEVLVIGWVIGMVAGVLLGTLLGLSSFANRVAGPFLAFFNGMPRLILYPFLAIWLGFDLTSKVTMVALVIVVPVVLTVSSGFTEVDRNLVDNVRLFGARLPQLVKDVYAPSLAIWVVSTARVTLGYAFQAAIAAEFVRATVGLGYLTVLGQQALDVNQIWAALIAVVLIAWGLDGLIAAADRRFLRWMPRRRLTAPAHRTGLRPRTLLFPCPVPARPGRGPCSFPERRRGAPVPEPAVRRDVVELRAVGDVAVDRSAPDTAFALVADALRAGDITYGNCETTYSVRGTPNPHSRGWSGPTRATPRRSPGPGST